MAPTGLRLCYCKTCGSGGQLVPAIVYRQHTQRQRRRTQRASQAHLLAELSALPASDATASSRTGAQQTEQAVDQQPGPSALPSPGSRSAPRSAVDTSSTGTAGTDAPAAPTTPNGAATRAEAAGHPSKTSIGHLRGCSPIPSSNHDPPPADDDWVPEGGFPQDQTTASAQHAGESVRSGGTEVFGEAFFAEDDEAAPDAELEDADANDGHERVEVADAAETYSAPTSYERGIFAGLVNPHDYPHVTLTAAVQPRWETLLYLFIMWLSSHHRLSDQLASVILKFIADVFIPAFMTTQCADQSHVTTIKTTLAAVKKSLGLQPALVRYVVCRQCSDLYPWASRNAIKSCRSCGADLHEPAPPSLPFGLRMGTSLRPKVFFTVSPVRTWLETLLQHSEVEDALDSDFAGQNASTQREGPRVYRDIGDGDQWRAGLDQDGRPFVDSPLSLQLTIGVDGFSPFKVGSTSWHSSGAITMMVNNLPGHLRHRHVHLAGITPGPQDPSETALAKLIAPIVEELKILERGIWVTTSRSQQPRLLRARLFLFCGDMPARAKACGFMGHRSDAFCPYCLASRALRHLLPSEFDKRDAKTHRENAILVRQDQADSRISQTARADSVRAREARWSQFYDLPYWHSVTSAPPEAMHAVFLGIVKRFWHRLFVDCIASLKPALLEQAQVCLAGYQGPLTMKRPDKRLGDKGGGNPNADQWCCLARNILVFQMADVFDDALCQPFKDVDDHYVHAKYPKTAISSGPVKRPYVEDTMRAPNITGTVKRIAAVEKDAAPSVAGAAGTAAPTIPAGPLDVLLAKRDIFLLAMHVAAIAELAYASELTEADVIDLERLTEGHLVLTRLVSQAWPTVNTHAILHIPEFVRRFGPCRAWWAFTFERINGWLGIAAGNSSNRKRDGQVEFSMMRAFWDRSATHFLSQNTALHPTRTEFEKAFWKLVGVGRRPTANPRVSEPRCRRQGIFTVERGGARTVRGAGPTDI